jgi:hypothetical protein
MTGNDGIPDAAFVVTCGTKPDVNMISDNTEIDWCPEQARMAPLDLRQDARRESQEHAEKHLKCPSCMRCICGMILREIAADIGCPMNSWASDRGIASQLS